MKNDCMVNVAGRTRHYLKPFPLEAKIPDVKDLIKNPLEHQDFMQHVFLNHKGLNWKIFRYKLNEKNYKAFFYAFAFNMGRFPPHFSTSWQVSSNARRLKKAITREGVSLSDAEKRIMEICLDFKWWWYPEKDREATSLDLQLKIADECGLISEHPSYNS